MKAHDRVVFGVAVVCVAIATGASAQERAGSGAARQAVLEEVVVTAQRREQSLQDVPVSVMVIGGDQLTARSENEISALEKFDPSVRFGEGTQDAQRSVRIRGVGTQSFSRGLEQSVAVVVDGVAAADVPSALLDMNDVSRIEVLRGPQGMLFGKNASAGLINITTGRPTATPELAFGISYAQENELKMNGHLSGPLAGEALMGRVSFYRNTRDPMLENDFPGGPDLNDRDEWGVRGRLLWAPNERFDALLTFAHSERRHLCCSSVGIEVTPGGLADVTGAPFGPENDRVWGLDPVRGSTDVDTYILELNYHVDDGAPAFLAGGTLTSLTGFQDAESVDDFRAFNSGDRTFFIRNRGDTRARQWTQELRFTSRTGELIDYVAGLYYYNNDLDRTLHQILDLGAFGIGPPPGGPNFFGISHFRTIDTEVESSAAFVNLTWNVADRFRVSGGTRFQSERASIHNVNAHLPDGSFVIDNPASPIAAIDVSRSDDAFSWRIGAEFDAHPDAMVYASVTRGYKGVGINALGSVVSVAEPIINPEIPINYEVGLKSEWFDRRLRVNAALFHTDFKDFQAEAITELSPGVTQFSLATAGKLETRGVELNADALLGDGLSLNGGITYLKAKYVRFPGAACYPGQTEEQGCVPDEAGTLSQDLSGHRLPGVSHLTYTLTGRYERSLQAIPYSAYAMGTWLWRSNHNPTSNPATRIDSYGVADLFLGIRSDDGRYSAQVFAKNLFDKYHAINRSNIGAAQAGYSLSNYLAYEYTRRFGVAAQVRF